MGRRYFSLFTALILITIFAVGAAEATGTLKVNFKYKNTDGTEQGLEGAYVYLRNAAVPPPMERFFSQADYVFGPADSAGQISVSVPEGQYFFRVTRRAPLGSPVRPLGPPEPGDYSWTPILPISITTNAITDLGTQYAESFGTPVIRISGIVRDRYGRANPGKYVRAQIEPCILGDDITAPNFCGPEKYAAQQTTDADGRYTIFIKNPGQYYIIVSQTLGYIGPYNSSTTGVGLGPVTVSAGDDIRLPTIYYQ
jgi:hypothetical protein